MPDRDDTIEVRDYIKRTATMVWTQRTYHDPVTHKILWQDPVKSHTIYDSPYRIVREYDA